MLVVKKQITIIVISVEIALFERKSSKVIRVWSNKIRTDGTERRSSKLRKLKIWYAKTRI
jgi:hypothetical protein